MVSKAELIEILLDGSPYTKKEITALLENVIEAISSSLAKGESVSLHQLGKLVVLQARPRSARNPHTGAPMQIPAKKKISFRPSKIIKQRINQ